MVLTQHRVPDRPGDPDQDPGRGRRLGIDCSDPDAVLATPVETVRRDRSGKHLRRMAALVTELGAVEVVVGLPRTLADRTGTSALDAIDLADQLARRIAPTPVRLADERPPWCAPRAAAVAILQSWLDQRRAATREAGDG